MSVSVLVAYLSEITDTNLFYKYRQLLSVQGVTLYVPRDTRVNADVVILPPPGTPLFEAIIKKMIIKAGEVLFASRIEEAVALLAETLKGECPVYIVGIDVGDQCAYVVSCKGLIFDYGKEECSNIGRCIRERWPTKKLVIYVGGSGPQERIEQAIRDLEKAGYTMVNLVREEGTTGKLPLRYAEIPIRDEDIQSAISIIYRHIARKTW